MAREGMRQRVAPGGAGTAAKPPPQWEVVREDFCGLLLLGRGLRFHESLHSVVGVFQHLGDAAGRLVLLDGLFAAARDEDEEQAEGDEQTWESPLAAQVCTMHKRGLRKVVSRQSIASCEGKMGRDRDGEIIDGPADLTLFISRYEGKN
jgi:hypothetical protein